MDKERELLTKVEDGSHTITFERNSADYILT